MPQDPPIPLPPDPITDGQTQPAILPPSPTGGRRAEVALAAVSNFLSSRPEIVWGLLLSEDEATAIRVLRFLRRAIRADRLTASYFGIPLARPQGRPRGHDHTLEMWAYPLTIAIDHGGLKKSEALQALRRNTNSANYKWLNRRLTVGRRNMETLKRANPTGHAAIVAHYERLSLPERKKDARELLKEIQGLLGR